MRSVESYLAQYKAKPTEDEKIKFSAARSNAAQIPGRAIWRKFTLDVWRLGSIHSRIASVLTDEGLHPLFLSRTQQAASSDRLTFTCPDGRMYVPLAVDPVALVLLGNDPLEDGYNRAPRTLRFTLAALIQRTWINLNAQLGRTKTRLVKMETEADGAFESLDKGSVTKKTLKSVIVKVGRWKALAEAMGVQGDMMSKIETLEQELQSMMVPLGRITEPNAAPIPAPIRVSAGTLKSISTQENVDDVINLYNELFATPVNDDPLQDQLKTIAVSLTPSPDGKDPGVEVECTMSPMELAVLLAFPDGNPLLFNTYRHRGRLNTWINKETEALFIPAAAEMNPDMVPLRLHWHQLA
ncbi:hypothetical protein DXG01_001539, partial [Tephrocybe rancida]